MNLWLLGALTVVTLFALFNGIPGDGILMLLIDMVVALKELAE